LGNAQDCREQLWKTLLGFTRKNDPSSGLNELGAAAAGAAEETLHGEA